MTDFLSCVDTRSALMATKKKLGNLLDKYDKNEIQYFEFIEKVRKTHSDLVELMRKPLE